jgi:hypothetical protein
MVSHQLLAAIVKLYLIIVKEWLDLLVLDLCRYQVQVVGQDLSAVVM